LRVHPQHRDTRKLQLVHQKLAAQAGVHAVESNPSTGSVLVHYDHRRMTRDDVTSMLRAVGVIIAEVAGAGSADVNERGDSATSSTIMGAVNDIDRRIREITGRKVDLRVLVPIGLTAVGIRAFIAQGSLGFTQVPAFLVFWYAVDSFIQLHRRQTQPTAPDRDGEGAA
jgi:hypothetical protein